MPSPAFFQSEIEKQLAEMTLEEKVGQVFMIGIDGTAYNVAMEKQLKSFPAGGVILFSRNVTSVPQLAQLTNALKENSTSPVPLVIGTDEEGGPVSRLPDEIIDFPSAAELGNSPLSKTTAIGEATGQTLLQLGIDLDFAPILDVNSNPTNPVIGDRSFQSNPTKAAEHALAFAEGLESADVISVGKHFPGHGDTSVDSHLQLPVVQKSMEQLSNLELIPFKKAIQAKLPALMVAHLLVPAIDETYPSSLSYATIQELLRDEMGYEGVIVTDDLTMGAIQDNYSTKDAALLAFKAGSDLLLICHGESTAEESYKQLLQAVKKGEVTEERLDESVRRLLALKQTYQVTKKALPMPDVQQLNQIRTNALKSDSQ